jgi:hypothetical protein
MKISLLLLLPIILVLSCRDFHEDPDRQILVILKTVVREDDRFKLYYIPQGHIGYSERHKIEKVVSGSDQVQNIVFELSEMPIKFRVDIGENRHETEILIRQITITKDDKQINIDPGLIDRYFKANIYIQNNAGAISRRLRGNRYDPFIESTALLEKKLYLEFLNR